jgi:hypothetical protein
MSNSANAVGMNIAWTVPSTVTPLAEVHALLEKNGFPVEWFKEPTDRCSFTRAVNAFANTRKHRLVRKIADNEFLTFGVVDESPDASTESLSYTKTTTVRYEKSTQAVTAEGPLAEEIIAKYQTMRECITDADVRTFLRGVIERCDGVPKTKNGQYYFVPFYHLSTIESARDFIEAVAFGSYMLVERIYNGEQERKNIWKSVQDEITKCVDKTLEEVENIESHMSAVKKKESKLEEFGRLMNVYSDLLGKEATIENLRKQLSDAENFVAGKMNDLQKSVVEGALRVKGKKTLKSAVAQVLNENGGEMSYADIYGAIVEQELFELPDDEKAKYRVASTLANNKSLFVKVRRGVYKLSK